MTSNAAEVPSLDDLYKELEWLRRENKMLRAIILRDCLMGFALDLALPGYTRRLRESWVAGKQEGG